MLSDQEVRREIWQTAMQKENNFASYMAGFLVLAGSISLGKNPTVGLAFCHTESGLLAAALLQKMYGYHPEISLDATRKTHRYTIDLPASVSDKLLADCHMRHLDKQGAVCYTLSLGSMRWANTAAFCAALCIEGGKLYTSGEYRLDMVLPADNKRLNELEAALAKKSIKFLYKLSAERLRLSFRKEDIASFLALVGAPEASLAVTEFYLERSVKCDVNRAINCTMGNIDKTYTASADQTVAIIYLQQQGLYQHLPAAVRATGEARLANPEASLAVLADLVGSTKITVYRRLQRIIAAAVAAGMPIEDNTPQ